MDAVSGTLGLAPQIVASILPAWLERLDAANAVIGFVTLVFGLLGVGYMALAFAATPQPRTEPAEPSPYPTVDRFLVPLVLPVAVALAVAAIIFLTSQILLVVPEMVATLVALAIALFILVTCAFVATAPKVPRGIVYTAVGLPLLALVVGGAVSGIHRQQVASQEAEARANAPQTSLTEVTTDNKFSQTTFNVPAGQAITITQNNKGLAIHNWHVLDVKDASGKDVTTPLTQPGQTSTATFTITQAGTYKFQCDVHPTEMIGTLKVS